MVDDWCDEVIVKQHKWVRLVLSGTSPRTESNFGLLDCSDCLELGTMEFRIQKRGYENKEKRKRPKFESRSRNDLKWETKKSRSGSRSSILRGKKIETLAGI